MTSPVPYRGRSPVYITAAPDQVDRAVRLANWASTRGYAPVCPIAWLDSISPDTRETRLALVNLVARHPTGYFWAVVDGDDAIHPDVQQDLHLWREVRIWNAVVQTWETWLGEMEAT